MVFVDVLKLSIHKIDIFSQFTNFNLELGVLNLLLFDLGSQLVAFNFQERYHIVLDLGLGDFHFFGGLLMSISLDFGDLLFGEIFRLGDFLLQFDVFLFGLPFLLRGVGD